MKINYIDVIDQWAKERYPLPPKACPSERRIMRRMRERYRDKVLTKLMSEAGYVMPIKPTT